ncbi:hypothetical protein LJR118_001238 [Acidovorax sp. LjRoot118]|uniref:hypothetical protein n=1 Tax=Acidovorax sp. LjRoot118 TaxID=3342256 RepID=UPI003ECD1989
MNGYLDLITPKIGDPTYSILKAHLIFEELVRAYLKKNLANAQALDGSRLTFSQRLAVARAITPSGNVEDWIWVGVDKLNKMRNLLAHEGGGKDLTEEMKKYVKYIVDSSKTPLPKITTEESLSKTVDGEPAKSYLAVDMVTIGMYYRFAQQLGFKIDE